MPEPGIRIVTHPVAAAEADLESVRAELRAFNRAANPDFYALRDRPGNGPRALHVVAYDAAGGIAGGLIGSTCLAWLDIEILAVRAADRRRGIGRRLLRAAEAEAVLRGCRYAVVDTADFQAPGFYERLGYAVTGRIEHRDGQGRTKFFLTRTIV